VLETFLRTRTNLDEAAEYLKKDKGSELKVIVDLR
jgi:hypothetical protein